MDITNLSMMTIKVGNDEYIMTVKDNKLYINDKPYEEKMVTQPVDPNKPVIEKHKDGIMTCTVAGLLHSIDNKPAIIYANRDQHWYKDGKIHRDNDKPAVIYANGNQYWYKDGKIHRDNGYPAIIEITPDKKYKYEYWVNGKKVGENIC